MSDIATDPKWGEFQKLVALIERHFVPMGATVRSPDRIPDKVTGQPREIDASVRFLVGSVPILITIECRDRSSIEDVTWIEQLVTKRESVGASATVAVSSTGFTRPALQKARANNIETRLLHEVSEETVRKWAQTIEIIAVRGTFRLGPLRLQLKPTPGNPNPELHPQIVQGHNKGDVEFKFILKIASGELISIGDLLREAERNAGNPVYEQLNECVTLKLPPHTSAAIIINSSFPSLFEDVVVGAPPLKKVYAWRFDPGEATVETTLGPAELENLDVEFDVIQRAYPTEVGRLLSYNGPADRIANVEERKVSLGTEKTVRIVITGKVEPDSNSNDTVK